MFVLRPLSLRALLCFCEWTDARCLCLCLKKPKLDALHFRSHKWDGMLESFLSYISDMVKVLPPHPLSNMTVEGLGSLSEMEYSASPPSPCQSNPGTKSCRNPESINLAQLSLRLDWGLSAMKIPQGLVYSLLQIRKNARHSPQTCVIWNSLGLHWSSILFCDSLMLHIWRNI